MREKNLEPEDFAETANSETENETDTTNAIGRVAAPLRLEATPDEFSFWIRHGAKAIERNQFVSTESEIEGETIRFYGLIDQVKRTSRRMDILEEYDAADGDVMYEPEFKNEGLSFAHVQILRTEPEIETPPIERSVVWLGGEVEASIAYGFDDPTKPWMPVGLLKNGVNNFAGFGSIDLDYLLGENGGHLNVNGVAGVGTKTSFLLTLIRFLQKHAEQTLQTNSKLFIVPIIFNVKGEDLMWIDKPNKRFDEKHKADWKRLGIEPKPFETVEFFEPDGLPVHGCSAKKYSWSLQDVLKEESLPFIFSEEDNLNENMVSLVREIVARITQDDGKTLNGTLPENNWKGLLRWVKDQSAQDTDKTYGKGTWRAIYRRLFNVLEEGKDIFPSEKLDGNPLRVVRKATAAPQVIDINALPVSLQRFVVGSVVNQVVAARKAANAVTKLRYVLMLDELNRFAPKNARDEITRLLERVATEMRSQGVILLGAQQMASQVSTKVIEMSSIRVLGRTGAAELTDKIWASWEKTAREKGKKLLPEEKLVMQPTFRQPMLVKVPMNPWADKKDNIATAKDGRKPEKFL